MAFVKSKFDNVGLSKKLQKMKVVTGRTKVKVGKYFSVEFVKVTHSITGFLFRCRPSPAGHVSYRRF